MTVRTIRVRGVDQLLIGKSQLRKGHHSIGNQQLSVRMRASLMSRFRSLRLGIPEKGSKGHSLSNLHRSTISLASQMAFPLSLPRCQTWYLVLSMQAGEEALMLDRKLLMSLKSWSKSAERPESSDLLKLMTSPASSTSTLKTSRSRTRWIMTTKKEPLLSTREVVSRGASHLQQ